jgi:phage I-like protein
MPEQHVGFLVDMASVKLEESGLTWIQAMPLGNWDHPQYGEIKVTSDRVKRFADNVKANVRGQDLNIDYDHETGIAAGWVKDAQARTDGLWLGVEFTKPAMQKLKEKEYRYFSPDFTDEWTHPATKETYQDVLWGGGLTNRPHLKGILPINLSEVFDAQTVKFNEGGSKVTPEQIKAAATKLGLGESASEDDVYAAIENLEIIPDEDPGTPASEPIAATEAQIAEVVKKLTEGKEPKLKAFGEQIGHVLDTQQKTIDTQNKQLAELAASNKLAEVENTVTKLAAKAKTKGFAVPPALQEEWQKQLVMAGGNKQLSESIVKTIETTLDAQLVQMGERTGLRLVQDEDDDKAATQVLAERIKKLREDDKDAPHAQLAERAFSQDPELYNRYRSESYANNRQLAE